MAQLTFFGSTTGVTGSLYLLETNGRRILLECGLIQGRYEEEQQNTADFPFDPSKIDAVILSHAHLDHSGRLPRLVQAGYKGPIYITRPTAELLEIMLKDAAYLSMRDAEWENRRRNRSGKQEIQPIYSLEDVESTIKQFYAVDYNVELHVTEDTHTSLEFFDAGHILGSAIVSVRTNENGQEKRLVFSGDLGNSFAPLLKDPVKISEADIILMESTYGDRNHRPMEETLSEFRNILTEAADNGGNVLIPSFAVGRTQEIIFYLGDLYQKGKLSQQMVFLDSPMAINATEVYQRYQHMFNKEDREAIQVTNSGSLHSYLPILRFTRTTEESMAINRIERGCIIIAASGMCEGGRIRHHLKHNLWKRNTHVMIVGFQVAGTTGRALVDGAERVRLLGEDIVVRAKIHTLGGFSAHAGQQQLIDWLLPFKPGKPAIYLVHGEQDAKQVLKTKLEQQGFKVNVAKTHEKLVF